MRRLTHHTLQGRAAHPHARRRTNRQRRHWPSFNFMSKLKLILGYVPWDAFFLDAMIVHHASPSLIAAIACCACGGRPSVRLARTLSSQRIRLSSNLANVAAGGSAYHVPVLRDECVDWLITDASGVYVDATLGGGGHSEEILARLAPHNGRLFSCDRDSDAIKTARSRLAPYVESGTSTLLHTSFANLRRVLPEVPVDGILLDLGVSSHQIDEGSRGFSFRTDGPLDMRMDQASAI